MREMGVPVLPGSAGSSRARKALDVAAGIGSVILRPPRGGGGRGMRV